MKLRTFTQALIKSITSPSYYLDVLNAPFRFSIRFFLAGYFFLALLATLFFVTADIPKFQALFQENATSFQQNFPQNLMVNWNGQELRSNGPQLLEVPYPIGIPKDSLPTKLAYIDTSATSVDQVVKEAKSSSLFVITKDNIYVSQREGGWTPYALKNIFQPGQSFTIDRTSLPTYITTWKNMFTTSLQAFAFIYPFAYFFIIGFFRLLTLLVNCAFIYYLLRLIGKYLPYKKVLQLGLHVVVVSGLLEILTTHLIPSVDVSIYGLSFWLYIILILLSLWNVKNVAVFKKN